MKFKGKPFIKWVGGKGQLLEQLDQKLPADFDNWENVTYIEPFVGGGAMLFYMLQKYPNIKHGVINDINSDLITCFRTVRDSLDLLIPALRDIQAEYYALKDMEAKLNMYMAVRKRYNEKNLDPIENTSKFFFLNRTCFNVSVSAMLVSMRQKKSLKFLFLSDIFLFPPIRQQVPILA